MVKAGGLLHTDIHTYIHTDRGYLIGPSPSGGPKEGPKKQKLKLKSQRFTRPTAEPSAYKISRTQVPITGCGVQSKVVPGISHPGPLISIISIGSPFGSPTMMIVDLRFDVLK